MRRFLAALVLVGGALAAPAADACMNPGTSVKIPVVTIDPSYDAGGWRTVHLGDACTLDWGGIRTLATDQAVYVEVDESVVAQIHVKYIGRHRRALRWTIDLPSGRVTRVGAGPSLTVAQAILPPTSTQTSTMRVVRIPRVPGFDAVGLELGNGVQSWATRCGSNGEVGMGSFVAAGRCRIAAGRSVLTR